MALGKIGLAGHAVATRPMFADTVPHTAAMIHRSPPESVWFVTASVRELGVERCLQLAWHAHKTSLLCKVVLDIRRRVV